MNAGELLLIHKSFREQIEFIGFRSYAGNVFIVIKKPTKTNNKNSAKSARKLNPNE